MRVVLAGLCALVTAVGLACAGDSDDRPRENERERSGAAPPTNVVNDREILDAPAMSPERSLLRFFQAVQFQDYDAARRLITLRERRSLGRRRLRRVIGLVGPSLGKPRIVKVRLEGDRAVVRMLVLGYVGGRRQPSTTSPTTFLMVRGSGGWLTSDLSYLTRVADELASSKRK